MDNATVTLDRLAIGYGARKGNAIAVAEGITGSIRQGSLTCLIGANGVGKSTLLKTLSAFLPKLSGRITLCGREIGEYTQKELAKTVGVVLTTKPDIQNMSVKDLVGLGRSPYTGFWGTLREEDERAVAEALCLVGIDQLSARMADTLSDGERQKMMIAKAIAQHTPVIFLDEPTAFLDFPSKVETLRLLKRLTRETGKTIFLSTHDVELALQVADEIWLMEKEEDGRGKKLSIGSPHALAHSGALSRFIERDGISFDKETLTIRIKDREAKSAK